MRTKIKSLHYLIALVFTFAWALPLAAQNHSFNSFNPFEEFDKDIKVATLSNGKYPEFFDSDTIEVIGSTVLNTRTLKVIGFVETDTLRSEASMDPTIVSRWLSPDPMAREYTDLSPYHYTSNNPIWFKELDGAVFDFSNMNAQEKEQYDALITKLSESDIFSYYYSVLDNSKTVYTVEFDSELPRGGQFNYATNTVSLKSVYSRYTAAQELFHAFQTEKGFYDPEGDRANIETEGDIATLYVMFQAHSGYPSPEEWLSPIIDEYGLGIVPNTNEVESAQYNELFQSTVAQRINFYEEQNKKFDDFFKSYTTEKSETEPKAIIKTIKESDDSLVGPRLENGDFFSNEDY